jgi:hypothetical protein
MSLFRGRGRISWFIVLYVAFFVMPFFGVGVYEIYKIKLQIFAIWIKLSIVE